VWMHRWVRKESPMVLQYSLKEMNWWHHISHFVTVSMPTHHKHC
jgi:hypothetical protein